MGKRSKSSKKRAQRRERAKVRVDGISPENQAADASESVDEVVESTPAPVKPEEHKARQKKGPKAKKVEDTQNAWERLKAFLTEVKIEAKKINWPSTDDTWKSTWVTIFVIIFLSIFMGLASFGMSRLSDGLFRIHSNLPGPVEEVLPGAVPSTPLGVVDMTPEEPGSGTNDGTVSVPVTIPEGEE